MQSQSDYSSSEQPKAAQSNPVPRFGFSFSKWGRLEAILGHFVAILDYLRTILAETGFVYELSEGFTELQKIIRVCQKEEIAA